MLDAPSASLGLALDGLRCCTALFDEIEKAHPRIMDIFLQILDAGRITLADGSTPDLSSSYVVFTSNIASAELVDLRYSSYTMERHVLSQAQQTLRPELFARITEKLVSTVWSTTSSSRSPTCISTGNSRSSPTEVETSPLQRDPGVPGPERLSPASQRPSDVYSQKRSLWLGASAAS